MNQPPNMFPLAFFSPFPTTNIDTAEAPTGLKQVFRHTFLNQSVNVEAASHTPLFD